MSSSDDEWRNPPVFPGGMSRGGGESSLLAARRQAAQRQREAAALRVPTKDPPALQENFTAIEQSEPPKQSQAEVTEEMLESLRRELEAKKKVLAAANEKETALRDRWRAQKAQKLAELAQLDAKLRHQQDKMEEVKAAAEREVRDAEDAQRQRLSEERSRLEAEIREQYEPQIAAQRALLEELQQREAKLQAELSAGDTAKDLVNKCIGSALVTILQRVEGMFADNAAATGDWEDDVQRLVRHEVRSSFAVASDSEAQHEREDYQKLFEDTLAFWRKAEEEERDYVLKMDEQLLLDLQSMVHDDLDRLQREELGMEELYVESREAWATQQQEMLKRELDAAMERRAAEFDEQRSQRHQLHVERMKAVEEKQQDMVEKQRWLHEKHMALLREQHAREEQIADTHRRIAAATHADVSRTTEEFTRIVHAVEALLQRLKDYRTAVDEGRAALDNDRRRALEARETTLAALQHAVTQQTVAVGAEHDALS
ncbi:hypothetical protein DQ04_08571040, partial [Trypanosoma grayi]|uniref:hypothetical protein n=1 Tax=Trypanosoma grayi TaxID=71804 RepID=UPI0004F4868A